MTSVCVRQHTQDVRVCPLAHTGRPWLSVCPCVSVSTHRTSMAVHQYIYQHVGPWTQNADPSRGLFGTHRTSVAVHQYTYQHVGPWTQHADPSHGLFGTHMTFVCVRQHTHDVRMCPSAHTGRSWLSISTHISTLVLGLSTLALPVDCLGNFGPRGLSVQYTQDVRGCLPAHTGHPWLSMCVHVCPCVSVCVRQHTQDVCGYPSVHISPRWSLDSARCPFLWTIWVIFAHVGCLFSIHRTSVGVRQHRHDVRGCPSAHTGRPWLSARACVCPCVSVSTHMTSVAVHPYTYQHVGPWTQYADPSRGLFGKHIGRPWLSVCVHVCPSAHTGRLWLSISTHISTLVHGLSTLALPVDCSGAFGPRGCLFSTHRTSVDSVSTHRTSVCVRQHTQDVCGSPSAHTGRSCVSVITHRTSVAVCVCPCVSVSTHRTSVACPSVNISARYTHRTSVAVCVCPCVSVSTHKTSVAVCVFLCVSVSTHRTSIIHTGRPWVSVSTHMTSVCVRQHTQNADPSRGLFGAHMTSVAVHQYTYQHVVHTGRPSVSVSTHMTSVCVRQHTHDVRVCPSAHTERLWLSVCVCVCPSAHTGRLWLSISTHISTLVLGLSTLTLPVDCLGDFGRRGVSVQYTQDVRGCLCVSMSVRQHTQDVRGLPIGRLWLSGSTHRTSVTVRGCPCVCVCPSAHTGHQWLSISTHISTLALPVDYSGDFSPRGLSAGTHMTSVCVRQHTQDVRGCPCVYVCVRGCRPPHTGRPWLSVAVHQHTQDVRVCPSAPTGRLWVSVSTHRTSVCVRHHTQDVRSCLCVSMCVRQHTQDVRGLSISKHISTLVLGLRTLTIPVDCLGDFGPRGLSVQYTQDVCGCLCVSVCVRQHTQDVRGCLCVSVCVRQHTQDVHQYTYQHVGPWTQHADPSRGLFGTHRTLTLPVDCSGDIGPRGLSVRTHISMLVLGLSMLTLPMDCSGDFGPRGMSVQYAQDVRGCPTHRTSVAVHQYTYQHVGPWTQHADPSRGLFGTHRTSVAVHQYTYQHVGPWNQHAEPSRGLFGTHSTSVAVHQYTYQHAGPSRGLFGTHKTSVAVRVCLCVSVGVGHHTQDVRGCMWLSVSTHRTSVCVRQHPQDVRVCPSAHTERPWLSISTHISTLVLGLSTLALPVDCLGDFGPRGCPPAHTGRPWLSVCICLCPSVSVSTHMTSVAVHQYTYQHVGLWTQHADPSRALFGTHRTSVAVHRYTYQYVGPWTQHADPSRGLFGTSVAIRACPCVSVRTHRTSVAVHPYTYQHVVPWTHTYRTSMGVHQPTQDVLAVCCCPSAHTGRPWLSVCVRVCLSAHTGRLWLSISTDISTLVHGLSTLALPVDCLGRLCVSVSTHRKSVGVCQHTQDVRVCPSSHTGRPWLSVCICVCPSAHTRRLWLFISTHISTLVLGLSTLTLPVDCSGDFGPRGLSVQYTQEVRGCLCVSVCVRQHTQDVRDCPSVHISACCTYRTSVGVRQHTHDIRVCRSAHTGRPCVSVSTHRTSMAVCVCPCESVSTHMTSVAVHHTHRTSVGVRQHTHDVRVCPSAHSGHSWLSVFPSAHTGRPWLSISTHISTLVLGLSRLTLCVDCSCDFGPRGLYVQYTQDVRGCPPAHTGRPWLSVSTHRTSVAVRACPCVSVCVPQHTQDVRGCPSYTHDVHGCPPAHTGHLWLSVAVRQHTQDFRGCLCVSVCVRQHTQDVRGCPSLHISARWTSVGVCQHTQDVCGCPSAHTGCPCVSVSTHRMSMCVRQHTQDVCGCPSAHTGRPCVSVITHRTSMAVFVCLCVSVSTHRTSVAVHQYTYQHVGPWTQHADPSYGLFGTHRTSVAVHQYTYQHVGPWTQHADPSRGLFGTSVAVRVCPSTHRTSVAVHQYTYHHAGPWTQHAGPSRGLLGTSVAVCVCLCVSVCVRVCPSAHTGRPWLSITTHISTLVLGLSTLVLPVDCSADFGPRGLSAQYTQDVCGCPSAHTGHPCVSVSTHRTSVCVRHQHRTSVGVRQHTQDVCVCPSSHTGRPWLSVCFRVCPSAHT
ncbi:hypothetical protein YC2023_066267 [Brassica napus]